MERPAKIRGARAALGRSAALLVSAAGTIALTALTLAKIPLADWNRAPATPFDLTTAGEAVQAHLFLGQAAVHVPPGTSLAISSEPPDASRELRMRRYVRALLPGRRLVSDPAAAERTIVFGGRPDRAPGGSPAKEPPRLVFETPYGGVWARAPRGPDGRVTPSRSGVVWLLSLALLLLAGAPLLSHPSFRPAGPAARAVLSAACGAVILSTLATLCSLAGIPWSPAALLIGSAAAAFALRSALRARRPAAWAEATEAPARSRMIWLLLSLAAVVAAFDVTAVGGATSVDLILQWGFKAQAFAAARGLDASMLGDPANGDINRAYPPLLPVVQAFATTIAGRFPWGAATLLFPLLLALLAVALPRLLARGGLDGRGHLAFAGATLAVAAMAYAGVRHEIAGNGDMPLWFFETLAVAVLSVPFEDDRATCVLGGLLLAGAAATKIEGLAFSAAAAALFLAPTSRRKRLRAADYAFLAAPAAVSLGAWFAFGISRRIFSGYGMGPLFEIHWNRTGEILRFVAGEVAKAPWPYAAALLFLAACAAVRRLAVLPLGVAAALAAFFFFTYLHGAPDPHDWILWSAARVFAFLAVLLILAGAAGTEKAASSGP